MSYAFLTLYFKNRFISTSIPLSSTTDVTPHPQSLIVACVSESTTTTALNLLLRMSMIFITLGDKFLMTSDPVS